MRNLILLVFMLVSVLSYGQQNSATTDVGVVINGVKWATRNVDNAGTFAANPESAGKFYQFNRKTAWTATVRYLDGWNNSEISGATWEKSNDPSPAGWRIPTLDEIVKLLDANKVSHEWTTVNGVKGRRFTDKTSGASIFLPASGYRSGGHGGSLEAVGDHGYFWSTTKDYLNRPYYLTFGSGGASRNREATKSGYSVRCVAVN
jgi:uncharacterized protein (TIGR02145 family)